MLFFECNYPLCTDFPLVFFSLITEPELRLRRQPLPLVEPSLVGFFNEDPFCPFLNASC